MNFKLVATAVIASAALALTGCAAGDADDATNAATSAATAASGELTVVIPAELVNFAQFDNGTLTKIGATKVTNSADGSISVSIPQLAAAAFQKSVAAEFDAEAQSVIEQSNGYITGIAHNDDYSKVTVETTGTESAGGTGSKYDRLGVLATEWQVFGGNLNPSVALTETLADGSANMTFTYPAALNKG